jgi:hypothetical protein
MKTCSRCKEEKSLDEFSHLSPTAKTYKNFKDGIKPWCKSCYTDYAREDMRKRRSGNSPKYDHYHKKYGLTKDEVHVMMEERNGKCDICNSVSDHFSNKLNVDHCHETGKVRGMLCFSCNVMLGQVKDDTNRLKKAIEYLERTK